MLALSKLHRSAAPFPPAGQPFPLTKALIGQKLQLVRIAAGAKLRRRLTELGLTPGVELDVLQDRRGPLLLSVRNTRLAIGRGVAQSIMVRIIGEGGHTHA